MKKQNRNPHKLDILIQALNEKPQICIRGGGEEPLKCKRKW